VIPYTTIRDALFDDLAKEVYKILKRRGFKDTEQSILESLRGDEYMNGTRVKVIVRKGRERFDLAAYRDLSLREICSELCHRGKIKPGHYTFYDWW